MEYNTMTELWDTTYNILCTMPSYPCRPNFAGDMTKQLVGQQLVLTDTRYPLVLSSTRNMSLKYLISELRWYAQADDTWQSFETKRGKEVWKSLSDDGIHVNSNYGHRVQKYYGFNQLNHAITLLRENKYTRQAVIHIKEPRQLKRHPTKDVCCTLTVQFQYDPNADALDLIVNMRSSDMWCGIVYDVPFFTQLQHIAAAAIGVAPGPMFFNAGNIHVYDNNVHVKTECESIYWDTELQHTAAASISVPLGSAFAKDGNINVYGLNRDSDTMELDPICWDTLAPIIMQSAPLDDIISELCATNSQFAFLYELNRCARR